ncbi:polymorphic toxin-type HINT domain-containing protein [Allohahella sp. A8]|uniref:polymorphic toxin-type HINT domain-containing protein n=1 Tax=Allohahella sp. A8 TaxID=3141461 RepID=UPI003A7FA787
MQSNRDVTRGTSAARSLAARKSASPNHIRLNRHQRQRLQSGFGRHFGSRGAGVIEFWVACLALLPLVLGGTQAALVYNAKTILNQATFEAARIGAVQHGVPAPMQEELARRMASLYGPTQDHTSFTQAYAKALVDINTPALPGQRIGSGTQLRVLNPTQEAFQDFGSEIDGQKQIPNHHLKRRGTEVGSRSKVNIQDANLLKIEVTYGYKLSVPIIAPLIGAVMQVADPANANFYKADPVRLPIKASALVRMHSNPFLTAANVSANNVLDGGGDGGIGDGDGYGPLPGGIDNPDDDGGNAGYNPGDGPSIDPDDDGGDTGGGQIPGDGGNGADPGVCEAIEPEASVAPASLSFDAQPAAFAPAAVGLQDPVLKQLFGPTSGADKAASGTGNSGGQGGSGAKKPAKVASTPMPMMLMSADAPLEATSGQSSIPGILQPPPSPSDGGPQQCVDTPPSHPGDNIVPPGTIPIGTPPPIDTFDRSVCKHVTDWDQAKEIVENGTKDEQIDLAWELLEAAKEGFVDQWTDITKLWDQAVGKFNQEVTEATEDPWGYLIDTLKFVVIDHHPSNLLAQQIGNLATSMQKVSDLWQAREEIIASGMAGLESLIAPFKCGPGDTIRAITYHVDPMYLVPGGLGAKGLVAVNKLRNAINLPEFKVPNGNGSDVPSPPVGPLKAGRDSDGDGLDDNTGLRCKTSAQASFTAGTLIATPDGLRPIENLKVGDIVWSRSDHDFVDKPQAIAETFNRKAEGYWLLTLETGATLKVTAEHPLWQQGSGWVEAREFQEYAPVATTADDLLIVKKEFVAAPVKVFNFSVHETPSYFAGHDKVWVHNAGGASSLNDCPVDFSGFYPGGLTREEAISLIGKAGYSIADYDKYIARKRKQGTEPKDPTEYGKSRDYFEKNSPIARGNKFNEKARDSDWYQFHEIHLANGKRLDSYDPEKGLIVSRKATDLDDITEASFRNYLKELNVKYPAGMVIRSDKYKDELDGKVLTGKQVLELPDSNLSSPNIERYREIAREYNIELIFKPE